MERTPWGDADRLRERMLRPGPQASPEEGARNQLERLYGAMVACVAEKGYSATTVGDLLDLSGVSRSSFYDLFRDKEDCFLATFDAILEMAVAIAEAEFEGEGDLEERARRALRKTFETIALQPAAADLCYNHPYDLGPRGQEALERAMTEFGALVGPTIAEISGREELPPEMIRALLGGAQMTVQVHLRRGEEGKLPDLADPLMDWALSYEKPPVPLRLTGRRPREFESYPPAFVAYSQPERIVRALAAVAGERGYPAVTIAEIAARAQMSQATFYANFADKEDALLAALDSAAAQAMAVIGPAARRSPDWPNALRAGLGALCFFAATEPDYARLAAIETSAAGQKALAQRDRSIEQMRILMKPGFMFNPDVELFVADAVIGAVWGLFTTTINNSGPKGMPDVSPLASYIALSPFIGAEAAAEVANGDGRGPRD
jgi:AcrR family transcriptional regulator